MVWLTRLAATLFVIALPLLLITTNVRFLAGEVRFYERGFREHNSAERTGLPLSELDRAAGEIVDYFENGDDTLRIVVSDNGEESALFNAEETTHMEDVKALMRVVFRANEISLAYVLTYVAGVFLWAGAASLRRLAWLSLAGVGTGLAVVGVIGGLAAVAFDATWNRFHELVFTNDFWQLNPDTDRLIQMFPEPFWEEATFIVGAMTIGEALAIVIAAVAYLAFARKSTRIAASRPPAPEPIQLRPDRPQDAQ